MLKVRVYWAQNKLTQRQSIKKYKQTQLKVCSCKWQFAPYKMAPISTLKHFREKTLNFSIVNSYQLDQQ